MPNSGFPGKTKITGILGGGLVLAAIGAATPAQACLDCSSLDAAMGALPAPSAMPAQPAGLQPNQGGPQPEPPTAPALTTGTEPEVHAALLLPAVQAAREAPRRSTVGPTHLPAAQLRQPSPKPVSPGGHHHQLMVLVKPQLGTGN